jgi:hypothetical protein
VEVNFGRRRWVMERLLWCHRVEFIQAQFRMMATTHLGSKSRSWMSLSIHLVSVHLRSHLSTNSKTINFPILTRRPINGWQLLAPHFTCTEWETSSEHRKLSPKVQHVSSIDAINYVAGEMRLWSGREIWNFGAEFVSGSVSIIWCLSMSFSREYVFIIFSLTCVYGPFRSSHNAELHNGSTS